MNIRCRLDRLQKRGEDQHKAWDEAMAADRRAGAIVQARLARARAAGILPPEDPEETRRRRLQIDSDPAVIDARRRHDYGALMVAILRQRFRLSARWRDETR